MPYEYIKPNKASVSKKSNGDVESKIQEELNKWRLNMREERRQRLMAATARASPEQSGVDFCALLRPRSPPPPSSQSPLKLRQRQRSRSQSHSQLREGGQRREDVAGVTALQEYRGELRALTAGLRGTGSAWWQSAEPKKTQQRKRQNRTVSYHKAQSVLKGYFTRPTESPIRVPKTPIGTLQTYKDALALSARACRRAAQTSSSWHQRPLRSISLNCRYGGEAKQACVQTTRSTALRKKHTELVYVRRNDENKSSLPSSGAPRGRCGGQLATESCGTLLEPTKAVYQTAALQPELSQRRSLGNVSSRDNSFQRGDSAAQFRRHQGLATRGLTPASPPVADLSPQQQTLCTSYTRREYEPAVNHRTPIEGSPLGDVVVSPVTPVSKKGDAVPKNKERFRHTPSPLLTELLSKLALPTPVLYRPDLYQGHKKLDISHSCSTRTTTAVLP